MFFSSGTQRLIYSPIGSNLAGRAFTKFGKVGIGSIETPVGDCGEIQRGNAGWGVQCLRSGPRVVVFPGAQDIDWDHVTLSRSMVESCIVSDPEFAAEAVDDGGHP